MAHVISKMPAGTIVGEGMHDPFGPAPDGIPIRVSITIDPEAGMIEADLTDNIDCLPAGVNESRTCSLNNCMTGIFNSIDPDIPHNAGTFRRVKVKLRENCVVGIPRFPHSCSVATTNVGERLVVTTQRTIADAWDGYGLAEGACGIGPGLRGRLRDGLAQGRQPVREPEVPRLAGRPRRSRSTTAGSPTATPSRTA